MDNSGARFDGLNYDSLRTRINEVGYPFFDEGNYNLNLIGVRTRDRHSNTFNDILIVAYRNLGIGTINVFPITTDPGVYFREHPLNIRGTAILAQGHHSKLWTLGKHQGKYDALVQINNCVVYRDNNMDQVLDMCPTMADDGLHGINLHKAGHVSSQVDRWSAGCQVMAKQDDYDILMAIIKRSHTKWGPFWSYTLIDEELLYGF